MKSLKSIGGLLAVVCLAMLSTGAKAQLWYNGDFDNSFFLYNQVNNVTQGNSLVYDDFIVPVGQSWNITSVFSDNQMNFVDNTAVWEIRTGVGPGNPGVLVASGSGAASQIATGNVGAAGTEYRIETAASALLPTGIYWLAVAPSTPTNDGMLSFLSTTSKANAIGQPAVKDGNSYINYPAIGANFTPSGVYTGPNNQDFSLGIRGTAITPEYGSVFSLGGLLAAGGAGLWFQRRRRKNATKPETA